MPSTRNNPSPNPQTFPCGKCKDPICDGGVLCKICQQWHHLSCVGLPEDDPLLASKQIHWFCESCNEAATTLFQNIHQLKELQTSQQRKLNTMKQEILQATSDLITTQLNTFRTKVDNDLKSKVDNTELQQCVTTEVASLKTEIQNEMNAQIVTKVDEKTKNVKEEAKEEARTFAQVVNNTKIKEDLKTELTEVLDKQSKELAREEALEREMIQKRKLNLVIHNLEESQTPEEDVTKTKTLLDTLGIREVEILNPTRLGYRNEEKNRIFRFSVENLVVKKTILSKAPQLRQIPEDEPFCRVYIRPDLTPKQLESSKNLHRELKDIREKNQEKKYKIYRGKIVQVEEEVEVAPIVIVPTQI